MRGVPVVLSFKSIAHYGLSYGHLYNIDYNMEHNPVVVADIDYSSEAFGVFEDMLDASFSHNAYVYVYRIFDDNDKTSFRVGMSSTKVGNRHKEHMLTTWGKNSHEIILIGVRDINQAKLLEAKISSDLVLAGYRVENSERYTQKLVENYCPNLLSRDGEINTVHMISNSVLQNNLRIRVKDSVDDASFEISQNTRGQEVDVTTTVNTHLTSDIRFVSKNTNIAYTAQIVEITHDQGKTYCLIGGSYFKISPVVNSAAHRATFIKDCQELEKYGVRVKDDDSVLYVPHDVVLNAATTRSGSISLIIRRGSNAGVWK